MLTPKFKRGDDITIPHIWAKREFKVIRVCKCFCDGTDDLDVQLYYVGTKDIKFFVAEKHLKKVGSKC